MNTAELPGGGCRDGQEILEHLRREDLLQLAPGERLWKLYCFRPPSGQATALRHRIYTKLRANGRLSLVTFAVHNPAAGRSTRSGIARVPDLSDRDLQVIIQAIHRETGASPEEYEEVDLTRLATLGEQLTWLEDQIG